MTERFSNRQGYRPPPAQITVREDAPVRLRGAIRLLAQEAGMCPSEIRDVVCRVLLKPPDDDNWSEYPNIWNEVGALIYGARWYEVYDLAEALHAALAQPGKDHRKAEGFQRRLNNFLAEQGIGWELQNGQITHRGSEAFARSTHEVSQRLDDSGRHRAAGEIREALADISRRPDPDITGAIQHAMAALGATARDVTGPI